MHFAEQISTPLLLWTLDTQSSINIKWRHFLPESGINNKSIWAENVRKGPFSVVHFNLDCNVLMCILGFFNIKILTTPYIIYCLSICIKIFKKFLLWFYTDCHNVFKWSLISNEHLNFSLWKWSSFSMRFNGKLQLLSCQYLRVNQGR